MEWFVSLMVKYGLAGMFLSAFLAGSIIPVSSEVVMGALQVAGVDQTGLIVWATIGNTLGSLLNYGLGRLGKQEWIVRYIKVKPKRMEQANRFVQRYGAWMGLLAWLPVLGEALTVALGLFRSNLPLTALTVFVGKLVRYWILAETIALF